MRAGPTTAVRDRDVLQSGLEVAIVGWAGRACVSTRLLTIKFTAVVKCGAILPGGWACQVTRRAKRKQNSTSQGASVRATISFPSDSYQTLEEIARQKKVSLAWVVREATDQYIADKWPLLFKGKV
jgi:hypothetical protein